MKTFAKNDHVHRFPNYCEHSNYQNLSPFNIDSKLLCLDYLPKIIFVWSLCFQTTMRKTLKTFLFHFFRHNSIYVHFLPNLFIRPTYWIFLLISALSETAMITTPKHSLPLTSIPRYYNKKVLTNK